MHSRSSLRVVVLLIIASAIPTAAYSYCGDGPAAITSVVVGPFDQSGNFTVLVGYQNAAELSWWWNNGGQNNAQLYENNRPNPYGITLNAACLTGTPILKVHLRNCLHGVTADDDERDIPISPPEPVMVISNPRVEHGPASRVTVTKFDYEARMPGLNRMRAVLVRPNLSEVVLNSWPDNFGNWPTPGTVSFEGEYVGTLTLEGTVCSKTASASIRVLPPCDDCKDLVGHPIALEGGNMTFADTDPLPGTRFFSLRRRYDSQMSRDESVYFFGKRFRSHLDAKLRELTSTYRQTVVAADESGVLHTFVWDGDSFTNADPASNMRLTAGPNGGWLLSDQEVIREFSASGRITAYRDSSTSRAVIITYDAAGFPARVEDSWGNWAWTIAVDPGTGLIQSITAASSSVSYSYTPNKELREVATADGLYRTYEYQPVWNGALVSTVKDGAGRVLESHTYDWIPRPITSVGPGGDIELMEYELPGRDAQERATRVTWKSGRSETRYLRVVSGRWRTVETVNGCSSCGDGAVFAYDSDGRIVREQSATGYVQESTYDAAGRVTSRRTALAPSDCDPATATDRCRQSALTLPTVTLQPTSATASTRFEFGDSNWPELATVVATPSVLDPTTERQERFTYDATSGVRLTSSIVGLSGTGVQQTRTMTATLYDGTEGAAFAPGGAFQSSWLNLAQPRLIARTDGPRTDVVDVMTFVYYPIDPAVPGVLRGRLAAQRNATGHITRFESYDAFGNILRTVDPNGVTTEATFDSLGRPTGTTLRAVAGCDTSADPICATDLAQTQTYAGAAALTSEQRATGVTVYEYDARNRLQAISRGPSSGDLRERVEYTYDPATGNRATERTFAREAAAWVQKRIVTSAYDTEGRLIRQTHADNTFVSYAYDPDGRLTSVQDENHSTPNTTYRYDGAGRLATVTQTLPSAPSGVVTSYAYDAHGNLSRVTDPNGNVTNYTYNDFGETTGQSSAVTGATTYAYDAGGNLLTTTDANGATTTRTYDPVGRPLTMVSSHAGAGTESVSWTYDAGPFGAGRLSSVSDPTGSTSYSYDRRGLLTSEAKSIGGTTYTTRLQHDSDANRSQTRYPSGTVAAYTHDFAGRPITTTYGTTTIISEATYLPFGPLKQLEYGNGTTRIVAYDQRYRITTNALSGAGGTIASYAYGYDNTGNVTAITDAVDQGYNRSFSYDDLHRLTGTTTGASLWGSGAYAYDAMGNLQQASVGADARTFAYSGTTPKLSSATRNGVPKAVAYDPAGNETLVGTDAFGYGSRNHLIAAGGLRYVYDARGVRTTTLTSVTATTSTLSSLTLAATTVNSETPVSATITLNAAAPPGGIAVALTTDNPSTATVPASVPVPEGATAATFQVTTHRYAATATATITAQHQESTRTAVLTVVRDPRLIDLAVPLWRTGAGTSTGTVTVDTPAPNGGVAVTLSSSHAAVSVPSQVIIEGGSSSAPFTLTTSNVTDDIVATLSATLYNTRTATMTVYAPGVELAALSVSPGNVVGGVMSSIGTIVLTAAARPGGAIVTLTSSDTGTALVPANVTVLQGATSAEFTISTQTVGASTPVTIAGTYGVSRTDQLTVGTCGSWIADTTSIGPETVWFDDVALSNAQYSGPWIWDTTQKNSGVGSHTSGIASGHRQSYFVGSSQTINPVTESDVIVTYVMLDPCNPPREVVLQFYDGSGWEHRAYWGENLLAWGVNGTPSRYRVGDLPPVGRWVRLQVSASALDLVGRTVSGMSFDQYDGRVWFDRSGIAYCTFTAQEPAVPADDIVWMEDGFPPETSASAGVWNWDAARKVSGIESHTEPPKAGYYQHYFTASSGGLAVSAGEKLIVYALINPCDPPREIVFQFYDGSSWEHRAYWGENLFTGGSDGTDSRRRIGDLPVAGEWARLEIPSELVGMAGQTVKGISFGLFDGQAWFDRAGKMPAVIGMTEESIPATMISAAGESPGVREASVAMESKPAKGGFWRRFMRKILRRPETSPPVSFTVYAQLTPQMDSTIEMKRHSLYTPELQLMAETSTSALTPWIANEYVWFNGEPVAQINRASGEVAYYFNDHLGAPILQTDATGAVIWRVERDPYGERYATRVGADRHQPLGLPGQECDESSDRQYNIFRWYRAGWGRYTQADPIGVVQMGEPRMDLPHNNLFGYVSGRPTTMIDPYGLKACKSGQCADCPSGVWTLTKMTQRIFFVWGFTWETITTYSCYGSTLSCTTVSECQALGAGWGAGVSISGGVAGTGNCKCIEDLGKRDTIAVSFGPVSAGLSNSQCGGLDVGVGKGFTAGLPSGSIAAVKCKAKSKTCQQ